jgi:glycerophosphoryl diester phosphodiesterase
MTFWASVFVIVMVWFSDVKTNSVAASSLQPGLMILAHRGASGYVPEHSIEAYDLAIEQQADYIEPDLCLSKDGVLVAVHDIILDDTTDVADFPGFLERRTTKVVERENLDDIEKTGYFVSDFSFAELRQLSLKMRFKSRTKWYDDKGLKIPSLGEILKLPSTSPIRGMRDDSSPRVGLYLELKEPQYHNSLGQFELSMEEILVNQLIDFGIQVRGDAVRKGHIRTDCMPVILQSFYEGYLRELRRLTELPIVKLIAPVTNQDNPFEEDTSPSGAHPRPILPDLERIAEYAQGVAFDKNLLLLSEYENALAIMRELRSTTLAVHVYTSRQDVGVLKGFHDTAAAQGLWGDHRHAFILEQSFLFCCLGVDGIFTEHPDSTGIARDRIYGVDGRAESTQCTVACTDIFH